LAEAKGQALAQLPQGQAVYSEDQRSLAPADVLLLHFAGNGAPMSTDEQTLLTGWTDAAAPDAVWVGLQGTRLEVRLSPERGAPARLWRGAAMGEKFAFDVALHGALGPGGVLFRAAERDPWTSLAAGASTGFTPLNWPNRWSVGLGRAGYTRAGVEPVIAERVDPFLGSSLQVRARLMTPKAS
jgi:hypothetical protein